MKGGGSGESEREQPGGYATAHESRHIVTQRGLGGRRTERRVGSCGGQDVWVVPLVSAAGGEELLAKLAVRIASNAGKGEGVAPSTA